jgi:nicotinamidase-related amidase
MALKTAVLVIDVQQGLCEGEGKAFDCEAVISLCGMHTEFCVDTTTRRALALGYPVTLIADAHTSAGNAALTPQQVIQHHNATLTNISSFGPRVSAVSSEELRIGA